MHAEIHLTQNGADQRVILDGQDITRHVLQAGFSIELTEVLNAHNGDLLAALPVIRMTIRPDTIDVTGDLAAAIELAHQEQPALLDQIRKYGETWKHVGDCPVSPCTCGCIDFVASLGMGGPVGGGAGQ